MTESGSKGLSLVSIYFVPVNTYPKKEDNSHKQYYLGSFYFVKTLDKHLSENRVCNN